MHSFNEKDIVYIEHCINCHDHKWCTNHNEQKYIDCLCSLKTAITAECPHLRFEINSFPLVNTSNQFQFSPSTPKMSNFPRLGSFEIYFQGSLLFSKLKKKLWPKVSKIAKKISVLCQPLSKISHNHERNAKNSSALTTFSSRHASNPQIESTQSKKIIRIRSPKFKIPKLLCSKARKAKTQKALSGKQSQKKLQQQMRRNSFEVGGENPHPLTAQEEFSGSLTDRYWLNSPTGIKPTSERLNRASIIIKSYIVRIPLNTCCQKKIPILNQSSNPIDFKVSVSHPDYVEIRDESLQIPAYTSDSAKLTILSKPVNQKQKVLLKISSELYPANIYELILEYI